MFRDLRIIDVRCDLFREEPENTFDSTHPRGSRSEQEMLEMISRRIEFEVRDARGREFVIRQSLQLFLVSRFL